MKTKTLLLFLLRNGFLIVTVLIFFSSCTKKDFQPVDESAVTGASDLLAAGQKPNIIFILADDVGYEVPTYTGGESYNTPTLDMMSHYGMQLTQCQAAPSCSPSRVMLMTGKYNFRNYTVWSVLDTSQRSIANMLKPAGYDNYVVGKWQYDGGDAAIKKFGFDDYIVLEPYALERLNKDNDPRTHGRYKSPELFANGKWLNPDAVVGKYSEDIMQDSLVSYVKKSQKSKHPFFIYYSLSLCHQPYSPTPDDPEYANWDPNLDVSDPSFYGSMVDYMDKKIGQMFRKLDSMNALKNTIVIFTGDNGTPYQITSKFRGGEIQGGKQKTNIYGTLVPLLVFWNGRIARNSVSDVQIDFTDFYGTIADMAGASIPYDAGQLDTHSFYPFLRAQNGTPRDWTFCHFDPEHNVEKPVTRWVQNVNYKLYDSTGAFYNIITDSAEKFPIKNPTPAELILKNNFQHVLDSLHN